MSYFYINPLFRITAPIGEKINEYKLEEDVTNYIRRPDIQKSYEEFKKQIKDVNQTLEEYVENCFFDFPQQKMTIVECDYPYLIPDQWQHLVIWGGTKTEAKKLAFLMFDITKIVCIFQQPSKNQSVRGIPHYHLFLEK
jgi:hypothetical protein